MTFHIFYCSVGLPEHRLYRLWSDDCNFCFNRESDWPATHKEIHYGDDAIWCIDT